MRRISVAAVVLWVLATGADGVDWPMYRSDAGRTGYTTDELPAKVSLCWTYRPRQAPRPAWPLSDRMTFDRTYHPVIAGGLVYFGSSADGKIYALDAKTGEERWSFFTDAPVRFAPVAWKDRLFAGSDDGFLCCLSADDGKLLWKKLCGPDRRMVLGNGRLISRWPIRGGPAIVDDVLYYGAGIWPSNGIYIYARDADTGDLIWCNDSSGRIRMGQPHPGAEAESGVAAQGYLVVTDDQVLVPTGRGVPAAFNRTNGEFQYLYLQKYPKLGESPAAAIGPYLFNSHSLFNPKDGEIVTRGINASAVAGIPGTTGEILYSTGKTIAAVDRANVYVEKTEKRGEKEVTARHLNPTWSLDVPECGLSALIQAGSVVVCGAEGKVTGVDLRSRAVLWTKEVEGSACGLAAADGRLYVTTDKGTIYCFGANGPDRPAIVETRSNPHPYEANRTCAAAADEIIKTTQITEGYCLNLGCGTGQLAYELAQRTNLKIYAIDPDADNVAVARAKLDSANLYGVRVTVHQRDPDDTGYPDYFADLVVSGVAEALASTAEESAEALRVLRPCGGVACAGKPGHLKMVKRGPLENVGDWTHQYCTPGNTCCSKDQLARGPLEILWFDSPDLQIPNRHGRPPSPLFIKDRLIIQGLDKIQAVDAYNGRLLWTYPLPGVGRPYHQEHLMGTAGTQSNYCLAAGSAYVHTGDRCLRLDVETGKKIGEFKTPTRPDGRPGTWGYIACADGILFGSLVDVEHVVPHRFGESDMTQLFTESGSFFALDGETGKPLWQYRAAQSIRHNAIAIGKGRVYLVDRHPADETPGRQTLTTTQPTGHLLALDARTGDVVWESFNEIFGTLLAMSEPHDVLLMGYQTTRFRLNSELGGRFAAFDAATGDLLWDRKIDSLSRPVLNDRTVYAEPGAFDLLTGEPVFGADATTGEQNPLQFTRSYGCGIISGSRNLLLFRSATLGYIDLLRGAGTENFGGIRPGCWINALPVGGLVLLPDATNVCTCSYLNKATIALQPVR